MKILVGNDPELFVKKDGKLVSAHGLIEGSKESPKIIRNGMVQVDGMALEFGILPASTEEEFVFRIEDVMEQLRAMVPDYELAIQPIAEFGKEYIEAQPEEAKQLGCSADYNAWTGTRNESPVSTDFRTASGHIHVGWTSGMKLPDVMPMSRALVKQLDFFLGLPSLIFDTDYKRREMYGKAGAFRPKSYGCEYRTLSNQWLTDKSLMRLVFNNTKEAVNRLVNGKALFETYGGVEDIINNSNIEAAREIMRVEGIQYE